MKNLLKLWNADSLAARVLELEQENARLKAEVSRRLGAPMFAQVAKDFSLKAELRDIAINQAVADLSPMMERSMVDIMKQAAAQIRSAGRDGLGAQVPPTVSSVAYEITQDLVHIHVDIPRACTTVRIPMAGMR